MAALAMAVGVDFAIVNVTHESAANAEESASTSQDLASQARELDSLVAQITRVINGGDGANG